MGAGAIASNRRLDKREIVITGRKETKGRRI